MTTELQRLAGVVRHGGGQSLRLRQLQLDRKVFVHPRTETLDVLAVATCRWSTFEDRRSVKNHRAPVASISSGAIGRLASASSDSTVVSIAMGMPSII